MNGKRKLMIVFLMMALALVACAGNGGEQASEPAVIVDATETVAGVEVTDAAKTEPPAVEPTAEAPEPTAEPTEAAPVAQATVPPAEPAPERLGLLRFRDSEGARAGTYQLLLEGLAPAPAGSHYELWLSDDSFNTLNLGQFAANSEANLSGSTTEDLLGSYNKAFISIEPDGVVDGEIGPIAFNGLIPEESLLHIRHVVTAFPANPQGQPFLIGADRQLLQALEHSGFLLDELAKDDIREAQRHAEHVINILDGETGANFGDLDGDDIAQNPGDGFGVRAYLEGAKEHAGLAADAREATAEVQLHSGHVQVTSDNTLARIDAAIGEALRVIASDSASEAQPAAEELARLLDVAYQGQDTDGDGAIAPVADEGGLLTAYEHALNMGAFEFFAAEAPGQAAELDAEAPDAEENTPPAPPPVTIDMVNFAYQPGDITVPAGTSVIWINKDDGARHSATAADGRFDTGLLDSGQEATIVLDTPGTYIYYCTLHGTADGGGMAATITVTE